MQNKHFHTILWSAMLTASLLTTATASAQDDMQENLWGDIDHKGKPWVTNVSKPYEISRGLFGRHISLWASHGRYYDVEKDRWKWQRPLLFGTTEDIFTPTIVSTYLMPMLENAGACIFTPRERDWQKNEVIVDNDTPDSNGLYQEVNGRHQWTDAGTGFAYLRAYYQDGDNPFTDGSCRMTESVTGRKTLSTVVWRPVIPEEGDYAVYVSYKTLPNSIDDAHYVVRHQGMDTHFTVNQKMAGGTWVYLGTFRFSPGDLNNNCVLHTNQSSSRGVVTADAVRFGGGMSNIVRSDDTMDYALCSGMPRFLEAARYSALWYGFPVDTYRVKDNDDYGDDINVRSRTENYLGRGSVRTLGDEYGPSQRCGLPQGQHRRGFIGDLHHRLLRRDHRRRTVTSDQQRPGRHRDDASVWRSDQHLRQLDTQADVQPQLW